MDCLVTNIHLSAFRDSCSDGVRCTRAKKFDLDLCSQEVACPTLLFVGGRSVHPPRAGSTTFQRNNSENMQLFQLNYN